MTDPRTTLQAYPIREGTFVRLLAATERGARWITGTLQLDWPAPDGDTTVYLEDDARFGDYDHAPTMILAVDLQLPPRREESDA